MNSTIWFASGFVTMGILSVIKYNDIVTDHLSEIQKYQNKYIEAAHQLANQQKINWDLSEKQKWNTMDKN
jgi:hypothetical protein